MTDPYAVLGVGRDASQADVRRAFRRLALQLHPDRRPGDPEAEQRFAGVSAAYKLLSDPERRAAHDLAAHVVEASASPGADLHGQVDVPFRAWVRGGTYPVELDFGLEGRREVLVSVEAGVAPGTRYRFPKLGAAGSPPGDLHVAVRKILDDPDWRVEDLDLRGKLRVGLADVLEGATLAADVFGRRVAVTLSRNDLSPRRLPRLGLRRRGRVGDVVLDLEVRWPTPAPALLRAIRESTP